MFYRQGIGFAEAKSRTFRWMDVIVAHAVKYMAMISLGGAICGIFSSYLGYGGSVEGCCD